MALLALFMTACTEDYTVTNDLTVNLPESTLEVSDVTVTPTGPTSINIVDYLNEDGTDKEQLNVAQVSVATGKMPANTTLQPKVFMSTSASFDDATSDIYEVENAYFDANNNISISPSTLSKLYSDKITRKPDTQTIYLATKVMTVTNKTTVATVGSEGGKYFPLNAISYTPDAVKLEDAYYYIGALTTSKEYKFTNKSGKSFYDDPIISAVIPAFNVDWHWFRIAGESSFNADGSINWDMENANKTSICPEVQNDEAREGKCINGTQSWHLIEGAEEAKYRITIDLLEMTYKIEGLSAIPEYYTVGTVTSWNDKEKVSAMFPTSSNTVTLTSYFTGAWDMRMWPAENFGNWDKGKAIGIAENGGKDPAGKLCWNTDNDGNLASPEAGYYTLNCDMENMTYEWIKCADQNPTTYEKIGLVGGNDDWNNDIFLTQVQSNNSDGKPTHLWYALNVTIESCSWGVKFRANGSWDVKDWGKGEKEFPYAQSDRGDNIPFKPGTYNIYFNDITGHYFFVAQ